MYFQKVFNRKPNSDNDIIFPYQFYSGWYFPIIKFYIAKDLKSAPVMMAALVDSGANVSIFNKESAELLGLTMSSGKRRSFAGVGSSNVGYEHNLYFDVMRVKFQDKVIFSSQLDSGFNLIGRDSFFAQFARVCFDENGRRTVLERR